VTTRFRCASIFRARTLSEEGALTVKKMEERIATMEQELRVLKERHQKSEARRKREEAQQAKKDEARRKLLAGTVVLEKLDQGEISAAQFRQWLDSALTQPDDRALFNL
jgi:hypothetical protein